MQLWSKLKVWREVWRSKGEFFSMNIKELIDEWYSFRPLPPLEETGFLELPLKLEDLPKAIQTLKIYEPYAEMEKYKNVSDLRRRIGDFITGNLMTTGWRVLHSRAVRQRPLRGITPDAKAKGACTQSGDRGSQSRPA